MSPRQRVVFDTNIYISALMFPGTKAEKAVLKIIGGAAKLLVSKDIIDELLTVLSKKFSRDKEELSRIAVFIADIAEIVQPSINITALQDEPDNRILECAVSGNANTIVTGDKAMLSLANYEDIKIISLSDFVSQNR